MCGCSKALRGVATRTRTCMHALTRVYPRPSSPTARPLPRPLPLPACVRAPRSCLSEHKGAKDFGKACKKEVEEYEQEISTGRFGHNDLTSLLFAFIIYGIK